MPHPLDRALIALDNRGPAALLREAAEHERTMWAAPARPPAASIHLAVADLLDAHAAEVDRALSNLPDGWTGATDFALSLPAVPQAVLVAAAVLGVTS